MMKVVAWCCFLILLASAAQGAKYNVVATRLNNGQPLLNHAEGKSSFDYNYNPAVLQWPDVRMPTKVLCLFV